MKKKVQIALIICAALAVLALVLYFLVGLPYMKAASSMPEGAAFTLTQLEGGSFEVAWPASESADCYTLTVDGTAYEPTQDTSLTVDGLSSGEHTITVKPDAVWRLFGAFGSERLREGEGFTADILISELAQPVVEWSVDDESGTLTARPEPLVGRSCELRLVGETEQVMSTSGSSGELTLSFGDGGHAIPEYGEDCIFTVRPVVSGEGYRLIGPGSETFALEREMLLPDTSTLSCEALGGNEYRLSWTEAKGDFYLVQLRLDSGEWQTISSVVCTDELVFDTGVLASCRDYAFRVVGVDEGAEEGEYVSESGELTERTELSPLYCTIWPLAELALHESADAESDKLATVPAAGTLCVLAEENGFFRVRYNGQYGYVDSNYCMINLPEYLGDLLSFDITNSYSSLYAVHGYEIPEVTGTVITGYEKVCLAEGVYLAPYLYPCCEKLCAAANAALEQGYRLKIYDSYRPNKATRDIYDRAELVAYQPVPELDIYGEVPEELPELAEGEVLTYVRLWTEGSYGLPNFLAKGGSMHNMGIALDLTLEDLSGEELEMQSDMHDLSIYSIVSRDNENALLLDSIMKGAGFGGLSSEWWHFQDNETRQALSLNIYMYEGVSIEGWAADSTGWRYRLADGSHITGSAEIDGVSWNFDEDGYCEYWEQNADE